MCMMYLMCALRYVFNEFAVSGVLRCLMRLMCFMRLI